ncbi:glutamate receptor ionotropic, kainate 2-like [Branchiostoma floridae x Branchiostoma japonicum]
MATLIALSTLFLVAAASYVTADRLEWLEVDEYVSDLSNRTLRVVTLAADGFVLISDVDGDGNNVTGNDRFRGFCMDLFSWISAELGFKYEYYEVEDGHFGVYDSKAGKWNGMIGDVFDGEGDASEDTVMVTEFWEAVWQSFVALVQLGPEFLPVSLSGRISAFFWGIGILVAISTYTANLAAFLTVKHVDNSISSAEDLLGQTEISYGTIRNYATWASFKTTTTEPYKSLGVVMQANEESVLVDNLQEGLDKMRTEKYALFADSAELDYHASRKPCDLQFIGRLFWQTGYGIFLPKNSRYTMEFNRVIVAAKERGVFDALDAKWIKSQECSGTKKSVLESSVIGLQDMLGVFVLVYGGMALAIIVLIGEFIYKCAQDVKKYEDAHPKTLTEAAKTRLKMIFSHKKSKEISKNEGFDPYVTDLSNRTLRVVTIAADGFVLISDVDKDGNNVTGNDRFQG